VDVAKPGSYIILRNAKVDMFRGSMRLAVNQWGKVEIDPNPTPLEVKVGNTLTAQVHGQLPLLVSH
jgi:replication factor A1